MAKKKEQSITKEQQEVFDFDWSKVKAPTADDFRKLRLDPAFKKMNKRNKKLHP